MHIFRRRSRGARLLVALAIGTGMFGIATAVQASIPDGKGVIHGCYTKTSKGQQPPGALRVIDTALGQICQANEAGVNWSQTGPTGARGPTGPGGTNGGRGPTGPKGATGPSGSDASTAAYTNYGSPHNIAAGNTQTIASVTLPIGKYTLSGSVFGQGSADPAWIECKYASGGTVHQTGDQTTFIPDAVGNNASIEAAPVIGDVTVTVDNTAVYLRCTADDAVSGYGAANNVEGALIATKVGSITASS
jgi:hypothetical protein